MLTETQDRDAIVSHAIEIASAPVREAYIAGACGNDAALRQQVEELVAAYFAAAPGSRPSGRDLEQAGENHEAHGSRTRDTQRNLDKDSKETRKMGQKKPSGMMTVWALLLLPATLGGAGLTAWKLRAEDPAQATLQKLQDELDQARKTEAEVKKQLEQVVETRQALERERDQALAAEKEARSSTEDAKAVLAFLQDNVLLAPGRPSSWSGQGLGQKVTLRQAVDLAASKITGAFPDRPMVEASIREILGASYIDLGEPAKAVKQYERAFELRQTVLGPDHPDTCDCRNKLAVAYRDANQPDEASRLYDLNKLSNKGEATQRRNPARGKSPAPHGERVPGAASQPSGQKG